jgi:hypothetical protein
MQGYPIKIDNVDNVEDGQTVSCDVMRTNIENGDLFVEQRPNGLNKVAPVFQLIDGVREQTDTVLTCYRARMVIRKT